MWPREGHKVKVEYLGQQTGQTGSMILIPISLVVSKPSSIPWKLRLFPHSHETHEVKFMTNELLYQKNERYAY